MYLERTTRIGLVGVLAAVAVGAVVTSCADRSSDTPGHAASEIDQDGDKGTTQKRFAHQGNIHDRTKKVALSDGTICSGTFPATPRPPPPPTGLPLSAAQLDEFIDWVGRAGERQTTEVKARIAAARGDRAVVQGLIDRIRVASVGNVGDIARFTVLLSIAGELGDPLTIPALVEFIGTGPCEPIAVGTDDGTGGVRETVSPTFDALRSRAAEMLAALTPASDHETLHIINAHGCSIVRIATIDAYLFNHADSEIAKTELLGTVQSTDAKFVGLARKTRDMDLTDFDRRVAKFYTDNPAELAPVPTPEATPPPPTVSRCAAPTSVPSAPRCPRGADAGDDDDKSTAKTPPSGCVTRGNDDNDDDNQDDAEQHDHAGGDKQ
jgi:hypothetical protein